MFLQLSKPIIEMQGDTHPFGHLCPTTQNRGLWSGISQQFVYLIHFSFLFLIQHIHQRNTICAIKIDVFYKIKQFLTDALFNRLRARLKSRMFHTKHTGMSLFKQYACPKAWTKPLYLFVGLLGSIFYGSF